MFCITGEESDCCFNSLGSPNRSLFLEFVSIYLQNSLAIIRPKTLSFTCVCNFVYVCSHICVFFFFFFFFFFVCIDVKCGMLVVCG